MLDGSVTLTVLVSRIDSFVWFRAGESPRGVSPRGARRTGRDTLASSSSHHGAAAFAGPVCKQVRTAARDFRNPLSCTPDMFAQFLVFLSGPFDQFLIQLADHRVKLCTVVPSVVLEPAPDRSEEHTSEPQ